MKLLKPIKQIEISLSLKVILFLWRLFTNEKLYLYLIYISNDSASFFNFLFIFDFFQLYKIKFLVYTLKKANTFILTFNFFNKYKTIFFNLIKYK